MTDGRAVLVLIGPLVLVAVAAVVALAYGVNGAADTIELLTTFLFIGFFAMLAFGFTGWWEQE